MKIAIVGYGVEGVSSVRHWQQGGHEITVCDQDEALELPAGVSGQLGPNYLKNLDQFDLIVRTAGLNPLKLLEANDPAILDKVTSATNEFYRLCPTKNIIAITGTKGKGTTSTLIYRILKASGKTTYLAGNIGISPLDLLEQNIQPDDWVVLEQSSFQLCDQKYSPHIAVCLMVVPEHLDWHADIEDYLNAKQQLFKYQSHDDVAIYNRLSQHSTDIVSISMAEKTSYEVPPNGGELQATTGAYLKGETIYMNQSPVCTVNDVKLRGRHNLENVCAAIAATWEIIGQNGGAIQQVVRDFTGLEHRLEFVREVNGVQYFDDSFGTTPETAIVAIKAFEQPKVVILGGSDKGARYDELAHTVVTNDVRAVVLIGQTAPAIKQALQAAGYEQIIEGGDTITEIVSAARDAAQTGDVVLLSTGCASFGLFKNYKDRGEQFKLAVAAL